MGAKVLLGPSVSGRVYREPMATSLPNPHYTMDANRDLPGGYTVWKITEHAHDQKRTLELTDDQRAELDRLAQTRDPDAAWTAAMRMLNESEHTVTECTVLT